MEIIEQTSPIFSLPIEILRLILSLVSKKSKASTYFFRLTCKFYYKVLDNVPSTPIDFFSSVFNYEQYLYQTKFLFSNNRNVIFKCILGLLQNAVFILSNEIAAFTTLWGLLHDVPSETHSTRTSSWKIAFSDQEKEQIVEAHCIGLIEAQKLLPSTEKNFELIENVSLSWEESRNLKILNLWCFLIANSNSRSYKTSIIAAKKGCKLLCIFTRQYSYEGIKGMSINAAKFGHLHICTWIINDITNLWGNNNTQKIRDVMIMEAAKCNHIEICRFIKESDSDKSRKTYEIGLIAAAYGYMELFQLSVEFGLQDVLHSKRKEIGTDIYILTAARNGHLEICEEILKLSTDDQELQNLIETMFIHGASNCGNSTNICRYALSRGATNFNALLRQSAKYYNLEGCKLAKELGAENFEDMLIPKDPISVPLEISELQKSFAITWLYDKNQSSNGGTKRQRSEVEQN